MESSQKREVKLFDKGGRMKSYEQVRQELDQYAKKWEPKAEFPANPDSDELTPGVE